MSVVTQALEAGHGKNASVSYMDHQKEENQCGESSVYITKQFNTDPRPRTTDDFAGYRGDTHTTCLF